VGFTAFALGMACVAGISGCKGGGGITPGSIASAVKDQVRKSTEKRKGEKEAPPLDVSTRDNSFSVDDKDGKRLIEAQVRNVDARITPGKGLDGPVRMKQAKCRLFKAGKPQMELESAEAIWDGKKLYTEKSAHAVSSDKLTVMDAGKAVWTADTGHLSLEAATVKQMKNGKVDFTADAATAQVVEKVVTMPAGATGRNQEGQQLTAQHVKWRLESGKLEANGNVVIIDTNANTRITGQRLAADTRLKKGRLSGGARIHLKKTSRKTE